MAIREDAHIDEFHRDQQWHKPVRVATTANVTISTALNNGDSLDGVTLATGDRVLVKDQSTGSQNGIYVVGATPSRAYDMLAGIQAMGAFVYVIDGTANGGTLWKNTNTSLPTIDSTSLTFSEFTTGTGGTVDIEDEGSAEGAADTIDFTGAGVSVSFAGGTATVNIPGGGSSGFWDAEIVKSADQDVTDNSTPQDDSELQFAVTASHKYLIEWTFVISGNNTTGDFRYRFAVAAGTMNGRGHQAGFNTSLGTQHDNIAASAGAATGNVDVGTPADLAYPETVSGKITLVPTNTTTMKVQFSNVSAAAGRTSRMWKGSVLRHKDIS